MKHLVNEFKRGIEKDAVVSVRSLLEKHAPPADALNEGLFAWGMPPLAAAKSPEMIDLLLEKGASLEKVSQWWTPGFGANGVAPHTASYLIERGAVASIHALAAIGLTESLRSLLESDPTQIHAKGGDEAEPLHFASTVEVARILLDHGADPDARDSDHDSTPAQWRIADAPEVTRYLIKHGGTPDIFMAAGLGDLQLAKHLIDEDPECPSYRIGDNSGAFPGIGFQGKGGTIYQWTLGFNVSPHEIALKRGHREIYEWLLKHSAPKTRFLVACMLADRKSAVSLTTSQPDVMQQLTSEDKMLLAKSCWETNLNMKAVQLMLEMGFPVDFPETNHGHSPLHNAAWCGDAKLVELLLEHGHPPDVRDPDHDSTPIGWAVHSCLEAKRHPNGAFAKVAELLLEAGTPFDPKFYPVGHQAIDAVLKRHMAP